MQLLNIHHITQLKLHQVDELSIVVLYVLRCSLGLLFSSSSLVVVTFQFAISCFN